MAMNGTPGTVNLRLRTPNGGYQEFDLADFGPYPLWSTARLAKTQQQPITYFNYAIGAAFTGGGGAIATKWETNILNGNGQLGAAEEMLIYSLRIIVPSTIVLADFQVLERNVYTALYIAIQKPAAEGQLSFFPAGGGIYGVTQAQAAELWTNGVPQSAAARVFATPHYLNGLVNFWAQQEFRAALTLTATQDLTIVLDGLRKRPVG